ncbi:hypothetical protein LRH25_14415 [Ideonella azotifigens]|uniref:M23 family metallopeptidase n=1 Tax=Ideonella azotifigens TaxID=513160 RepID=A0ABN1KNC1_9BURK|nr:M23 family metallopeptidase [Ideonella azotifigens]MCD2341534.1 hypothetical protein [Ideonella azotifigens]
MLVSYPILMARQANESDEAYLERLITTHVNANEGRYPVSSVNTPAGPVHRWHGGIHLTGNGEPIRAIADGVVVAFRFAAAVETYPGQGDYDTSFVLIRHTTKSGENTDMVFHSLYMHLANRSSLQADRLMQLPAWLRQATSGPDVVHPAHQLVWRKDVLGFAGTLYGREACHFEVFATEASFNAFWRDSASVTQGSGSADFFGRAHFVIPAQQQFAASHPNADAQGRLLIQDSPGTQNDVYLAVPAGQAGQNPEQLFVSVSLLEGRRTAVTYRTGANGTYEQVGAPVTQDDYEYELFRLSSTLYADCPSAGWDWLRFGRVLGPEATQTRQNWQLVRYSPDAVGYIDLAPNAIAKLSDADFPHWLGWERRDEGQATSATDGICDDAPTIALSTATDDTSRLKLRHLICKAPTEWDAGDLATRYARLRDPGQPLETDTSWQAFEQHVQHLAFWNAALGDRSVWHFHPLQFIDHYRRCGWRSQRELLQLVPQNIIRKPGSHNSPSQGHWESPPIGPANTLLSTHATELNKALRKFCIDTPIRQACFFGNAVQETQWFRFLRESNGTQATLHSGWYGRGYLQLTNPNGAINGGNNNYYKYFRFLGHSPVTPPGAQEITWRDSIGTDAYHAAHSAGAYWVWPNKSVPTAQTPNRPQVDSANKYADVTAANQRRTIATTAAGNKSWYYNQSFTNCAAAVNYPATVTQNPPDMNGLVDRSTAFANALMVLDDMATFPDAQGTPQRIPADFVRRTVT